MPANENTKPELIAADVAAAMANDWINLRLYVHDLEHTTMSMIRLAEDRRAQSDLTPASFTETDVYAGQLQMLTAIAGFMDNSNVTRG